MTQSTQALQHYYSSDRFELESGEELAELSIGYHTFGQLNDARDNVVWVCHALTANSNPLEWWPGVIGEGTALDPNKYFIVCANILGSCYGTTGPLSVNPKTGEPYFLDFPAFTIRDMVKAHDRLRHHLGINGIEVCIGGSCGGHQVLEYAIMFPELIRKIVVLVSAATESAWRIAVHTTQRLAIEADHTWGQHTSNAAAQGLGVARGIGLLTYRTPAAFVNTQSEESDSKLDDYKASSYIRYQGEKLIKRFNAYSYWHLTKALDTHNISRDRNGLEATLAKIEAEALILSIDSDILIPPYEQEFLSKHIPKAVYKCIHSIFGHDGFLIEHQMINKHISAWLES